VALALGDSLEAARARARAVAQAVLQGVRV